MIKRPKPGETEEDLLEFQRKFLAEKSEPSVKLVSRAGDKRKPSESTGADVAERKDVVQIEDLPEKPPELEQVPPVKKSKFRAEQELKKGHGANTQSADIVDDLDCSTATVLSKIIERDTRNAQVDMPSPVIIQFPTLGGFEKSSKKSQPTEPRKKSLFAKRFAENPAEFGSFTVPVAGSSRDVEMVENLPHDHTSLIDGTGLSATFGKEEAQKIHRENEDRLAQMSSDEILSEQQKLMQTIDPKLLEFLKSRKLQKADGNPEQKQSVETQSVFKKEKKKKVTEKGEVPMEVKKDWLNMSKIEYDKLEWMKDLPQPSAGDSKTGQQARFDFKGNILPADSDVPVNMGLHHHGDEPERAGYTLGELFQLARSSNIQQRTLALQVLARIINQAKEGNLSEVIQTPILPSILDAGVIFLLRWSLDDSTDAVVFAAVAALNALLVNQADEAALDHTFHWGQGHRQVCQAPSEPEDSGIKLPDVSDEKPEETDAEIAKRDLVLALLSRMCLLQRLKYILEVTRPQAPTVIAVLEMLTRIARHSPTLAYQVTSCPVLMDCIIKNFLPFTWAQQDISQPLSRVYGVPLSAALKLVRTVCQAGRNMASTMFSKYDMTGRLTRYLAVNIRDLNLPETEAYRLQIESLNTWKVCLCYGQADSLYLDLYNILIEELRTGQKILDGGNLAETKIVALIGSLESVLCVASCDKGTRGFKNSHDGSAMEVERSECVVTPSLNWSHVADLIQPIKTLLTKLLERVATTYHFKKFSLQVVSVCLNFVSTYYTGCLAQVSGSVALKVLDDIKDLYNIVIQHWTSPGFIAVRAAISQHSNLLNDGERNTEVSSCLPEHGNCTLDGQPHINITQHTSPLHFMSSYIHLVFTLCKLHRGISAQAKEETEESKTTVSPAVILHCDYIWSYLRKISQGKFSHLQTNYFTKFEFHLLYYFLKLATLPAHNDILHKLDKTILHSVALHILTGVHFGDEHLVHDLLSTVIFQPIFWQETIEDKATQHLTDLSLSEAPPTNLKSATEEDIGFKHDDLVQEAKTNLRNICSTYLTALQHYQKPLLQSRYHFLRNVLETDYCFTSRIGESLMPKDWMYLPLIELYNEYSSVRSEVQKALSTTQVGMVSSVLQWIYLLETHRPAVMNGVSITMKITRIMCTFLTGSDLFLDRRVYCFLAGLLRLYSKPVLLDKMNFNHNIPGLSSFYDLYISLLQQFEAVSFGDWLFGCYLLIPLQQRHSLQYRKAIWTEYTGILRILSVPIHKMLIPVNQFLEPEENNTEMIRLYFQSLIGSSLRHSWSPVLYLMAIHHVNRFMYTQDGSHSKLKQSMIAALLATQNEELRHHLLHYKKANVSTQFGMEFYTELPKNRQNFVQSASNNG